MLIKKSIKEVQAYIKKKPSAILVISFISLFIICSFLLIILEQKKIVGYIANVAYLLLIIGVGIEVYQSIKYGKKNEIK